MESVLTDVMCAIDNWLEDLTVKEERYKIADVQARIQNTVLQIQYDESIDTSKMTFVSELWIDILNLLVDEDYELLIYKVLQLFQTGEISIDFACKIITKVKIT